MREHIVNAIEQYIDKHYEKIHEHVDRNLEKLKEVIVEKLPGHVLEFLKKHSDDGDGHESMMEGVFQVLSGLADKMTDDYKDKLRITIKDHLDEVTVDSTDHLTGVVVDESKKAVREISSRDDDGESWWKDIDLSFLKGGREGIITKILEVVRPPIQHASDDINRSVSERIPEKAKEKFYQQFTGGSSEDVGSREVHVEERGIKSKHGFTNMIGTFMGGGEGGMRFGFIDKIFQKLPEKLQIALAPHFQEFEERLMEHLHMELHENIFKEENFLHGMKSLIGKIGDRDRDRDSDGKKDFLEGVTNAVESFFHKKK